MRRLIVLVALLGLVSAGCSRSVVPDQGPTVAPAGYSLPKGPEAVVSPGQDPSLTVEVPVGGLVKLDDASDQHALDAQIWPVLRLAEMHGNTAIYQAIAPGKVSLVIGAHGYPCPPRVQYCSTDTKGPLKLLVVVPQTWRYVASGPIGWFPPQVTNVVRDGSSLRSPRPGTMPRPFIEGGQA